ncbi:lipopolysaccharide biosynthesis protein [Alloyangia pacifica]|uniref:lipopolysaccharide biosynthesis protein n=1 Tax=Alloyangia pacifica TaxID=311180 RepID=UPI001CFCC848|nr:lipopolysaccharide biosynthesis protein [Alloyangia pacifica]
MLIEDYGIFSSSFAIASLSCQISLLGQSQFLLRALPRCDDHQFSAANGLVKRSYLRWLGGMVITGLAVFLCCRAWGIKFPAATVALLAAMAWADLQLHILRGRGYIFAAFSNRDIFWRLSTIGGVAYLLFSKTHVSAEVVLWWSAIGLSILTLGQTFVDRNVNIWKSLNGGEKVLDREYKLSLQYWVNAVISAGMPNVSTIVIAYVLSVKDAAIFFAALKTAQAMQFLPASMMLVAAPQLSRGLRDGDMQFVQRSIKVIAVFALSSSALILFLIAIFGKNVLSIFGSDFISGYSILIVIISGYTISALCGPTNGILSQSGNPAVMNRIFISVNLFSMACLPIAAWVAGGVGVAVIFALSVSIVHIWIRGWIKEHLGLESSILCMFRS